MEKEEKQPGRLIQVFFFIQGMFRPPRKHFDLIIKWNKISLSARETFFQTLIRLTGSLRKSPPLAFPSPWIAVVGRCRLGKSRRRECGNCNLNRGRQEPEKGAKSISTFQSRLRDFRLIEMYLYFPKESVCVNVKKKKKKKKKKNNII